MLVDATLRTLSKLVEFYDRAATFRGLPRERMVALGEADELFVRLYPQDYRALQVIRVTCQLAHAGRPCRDATHPAESRVVQLLTQVTHDAIRAGDLVLPAPRRPDEVAFTVWALAFGTRALMQTAVASRQLGITDSFRLLRSGTELLFDALGWQPLSTAWDYEHTRQRVHEELFPQETRQASAEEATAAGLPAPG